MMLPWHGGSPWLPSKEKPMTRAAMIAFALSAGLGLSSVPRGAAAQTATPPAPKAAPAHKNAAASANPFLSGEHGSIATWFSLGPQRNDFAGTAYDKDEVTGGLRANESITVYARRHVIVPEDSQPGTLGEPGHSDAAQPVVPRMGEGCSRFTVCVDPSQKGLFSSIFGN